MTINADKGMGNVKPYTPALSIKTTTATLETNLEVSKRNRSRITIMV